MPKPCPILDVLEPGQVEPLIAPGPDLRRGLPRYKIFEQGEFKTGAEDVSDYFNENMVLSMMGKLKQAGALINQAADLMLSAENK